MSLTYDEIDKALTDACKERDRYAVDTREATAAVDALIRMGRLLPVDDLRCPLCGTSVKWSCGTDEHPVGKADCENGRNVSRRIGSGPSCAWPGTRVIRLLGRVLAPLPLEGA
jgi:hypothetical protein